MRKSQRLIAAASEPWLCSQLWPAELDARQHSGPGAEAPYQLGELMDRAYVCLGKEPEGPNNRRKVSDRDVRRKFMGRTGALLALVLLLAGLAGPVTAAQAVSPVLPGATVASPGDTDVEGKVRDVGNSIYFYVLLVSGSVLVITIMIIGLRLMTNRDARNRAETLDWMLWVCLASGFIFGATFIAKVLVSIFAKLAT